MFKVSNKVKVDNLSAIALDTSGVAYASYVFEGDNISLIEPEMQFLPFQGQNNTDRIIYDEIKNTRRGRVEKITLGFGMVQGDTSPIPINFLVRYRDGTIVRVPVTLQFQTAGHSVIPRFPAAVSRSPNASEVEALAEINKLRASGTCGGQTYTPRAAFNTNALFDAANREYVAGQAATGVAEPDQTKLRMYALLDGYRDETFLFGGMQGGTDSSDGKVFIHTIESQFCNGIMLSGDPASKFIISVAFQPVDSTFGFWSIVTEQTIR